MRPLRAWMRSCWWDWDARWVPCFLFESLRDEESCHVPVEWDISKSEWLRLCWLPSETHTTQRALLHISLSNLSSISSAQASCLKFYANKSGEIDLPNLSLRLSPAYFWSIFISQSLTKKRYCATSTTRMHFPVSGIHHSSPRLQSAFFFSFLPIVFFCLGGFEPLQYIS